MKLKLLKKLLNHFLIDIELDWKYRQEVVILSLIVFIKCHAINPNRDGSYTGSPDKKTRKQR